MKRTLALIAVLAGLTLAQTTVSHDVTVKVPNFLRLTLDATDYLFDFTDTLASGSLTFGANTYPVAGQANYQTFLENANGLQDFAPTQVAGSSGPLSNRYGTLTVVANRSAWKVQLSYAGPLTSPLNPDRVKVALEKESDTGSNLSFSSPSTPTPITALGGLLINATGGGTGKSVFRLYYLLTMDVNDDFQLTADATSSLQLTLTLTNP